MDPLTPISSDLLTLSPASAAGGGKGRRGGPEAVRAAKDFEAVLLTKVVEEMARTVDESSIAEDAGGGQVYDLFYSQLAQELSSKGGLGLWKQIARQMGVQTTGAPASAAAAEEPAP